MHIALALLITTVFQPEPPPVYHQVKRGDLRVEVSERGEIKPAKQTDIASQAGNTTITWLMEDGTMVKKGEVLARLDDSKAKEALSQAEQVSAQKRAEFVQHREAREIALEKAKAETDLASLEVEIAKADVASETGKPGQKRAELKLRQAERALQLHQVMHNGQKRILEAALTPHELAVRAADEQLDVAKRGLAACVLLAPHDGMLIYYVPESSRFGSSNGGSVEVGATVKEGQKLLQVSDLGKMQAHLKIHESVVSKLRVGMAAQVRTAGLGTARGKVSHIAGVASSSDFMSSDVKVYQVKVDLEGETDGLKPSMTATVNILLADKHDVLQVQVQAVHEQQGRRYCFVRGKGRQPVRIGAASSAMVEIIEGLKEGDEVQLNAPRMRRAESEKVKAPAVTSPRELLVRSVRTGVTTGRRSFSESYGLLEKDLEYMQRQLPGLVEAVPVHQSQRECRREFGEGLANVTHVATTADWFRWGEPRGVINGRHFTEQDEAHDLPVIVLGHGVAEKLFPRIDPVGEHVLIKGTLWKVIGVLAEHPEAEWNQAVVTPARVARSKLGETTTMFRAGSRSVEKVQYHHVRLMFTTEEACGQAAEMLRSFLDTTHRERDWEIIAAR